jgi:hypothetical protein
MSEQGRPSTLVTPPSRHYCQMPTVQRTWDRPGQYVGDPATPTTWEAIPPRGSVWACETCGSCYEVVPPPQYANIVIHVNEWRSISARRYRRQAKRLSPAKPRFTSDET